MIKHVLVKQKEFDYNYYLSKNCPLLSNWKERKAEMVKQAKLNP
jgi:hypothetical protein